MVAPERESWLASRCLLVTSHRRASLQRPPCWASTFDCMTLVDRSDCVAYGCVEVASRGGQLCRAHQRRLNQGGGLPTAAEPQLGDSSSCGTFGVVDRNGSGVLCHECGRRFARLPRHLKNAHQITSAMYRQRHGIPPNESLSMPALPDGRRRSDPHPCERCDIEVITPGKLCGVCSTQRRREREERRRRAAEPSRPRWRPLTNDESAQLLDATPDDRPTLIQALQRDRVPSRAIGTVLGRKTTWMAQHHPRPEWGEGKRR